MLANDALTYEVVTERIKNAVAAGTTDQDGSVVDMAGFDAVRCLALLGTLTATQVTKLVALQSDNSDGSSATAIDGAETAAMADGDSNKMLILDVVRPAKRYVVFRVDRGTANAVIDGMIAEKYRARSKPAAAGSTISAQKVLLPTA